MYKLYISGSLLGTFKTEAQAQDIMEKAIQFFFMHTKDDFKIIKEEEA